MMKAGSLVALSFGLMALTAVEIGAATLLEGTAGRALVILPAMVAVMIMGLAFMRLRRGTSALGQTFAIAAVFWLTVLLVLGSMDRFTRIDMEVSHEGSGAQP